MFHSIQDISVLECLVGNSSIVNYNPSTLVLVVNLTPVFHIIKINNSTLKFQLNKYQVIYDCKSFKMIYLSILHMVLFALLIAELKIPFL